MHKQRGVVATLGCSILVVAVSATAVSAVGRAGPPVKAAGVGTQAALSSPSCETSTGLTKMNFTARPPCVRPFGKGEDNGGATTQGVTKDAVKVVVLVPTAAQQEAAAKQPGATPPIDQATGAVGSLEDGFRDFFEVYEHWIQTWGRERGARVRAPERRRRDGAAGRRAEGSPRWSRSRSSTSGGTLRRRRGVRQRARAATRSS